MSTGQAGDEARATVGVAVAPERAFEIFTQQVDLWWRRGRRFRNAPSDSGLIRWRASNFAPHETTEVEVLFRAVGKGTHVTVVHRGWAAIRPDRPARHGQNVPAFLRMMGLWWGDQLSLLRILASGPMASPPDTTEP